MRLQGFFSLINGTLGNRLRAHGQLRQIHAIHVAGAIQVKPGCVDQYLELARVTDEAVQASEPGMIHHTFDQDPDDPQAFVWSEVYANDEAFSAHVSNPPVQQYLQKHAELGNGFSVEVYGTVGDDCRQLMESFGLPLKIFETKLGYSRV